MTPVELSCTFGRATGERLLAVERLVLALPHLFKGHLLEVDLAYRAPVRFLVLVARFASLNGLVPPSTRDRLSFWAARAGGRTIVMSAMDAAEAEAFRTNRDACEFRADHVLPGALFEVSDKLFEDAGAPKDRKRSVVEVPRLAMDATGPGWNALTYTPDAHELFMAAPLSPPVGDVLNLSVRVPGADLPLAGTATVLAVRKPEEATPGHPAGFAMQVAGQGTALHDALASYAAPRPGDEARVAPRFTIHAPVEIVTDDLDDPLPVPVDPEDRAPRGAAPGAGHGHEEATIAYATEQDLHQDFLENLSHGGAFVRRKLPPPVGTPVRLKLALPSGLDLDARAVVAFVKPGGMGLKFDLDAETQELLSGAIAQISGRPRRALVVDDDLLICHMISDALMEKGYEVLTAADGNDGLRVVSEELLALDLLVTDVLMPGMDGVEFVRTIRKAGGESDLVIVAITGRFDATTEAKLEAAGADAVLDKGLGAELVAKAADAVLDRKRKGVG
ncbi:MAG: response regulator [Anaeromyxobacteraceae bacterium]